MRNANRIQLSPEAQAKLDSFLAPEAQEMALQPHTLKKYGLDLLFAFHQKMLSGAMITADILKSMVQCDTTMPKNAVCHECRRPITGRWRWIALNPDGSKMTFKVILPDGTTSEVEKERGQATLLPNGNGYLDIATFCPACQEKFELPKNAEWQSYIHAWKKLNQLLELKRQVAKERREAADKERQVEAAITAELEQTLLGLPAETETMDEDRVKIREIIDQHHAEQDEVEELTLADLVQMPTPETAAAKKSRKTRKAAVAN